MAKKKHRRKAAMTIPLAVVAGFLPAGNKLWDNRESVESLTNEASKMFVGFDPRSGNWDLEDLKFGIAPILVGFLVHRVASGLGVNRALGSARVPFLRI